MLHKARFPETWNPRSQPRGRMVVNWSHPMARDLIACYLPTAWHGVRNIVGMGSDLALASAAQYGVGGAGVGLVSTAANQGASVTAGDAQKPSSTVSMFWHGVGSGSTSGNIPLVGMSAGTSDATPFFSYALWVGGAALTLAWARSNTYQSLGGGSNWETTGRVANYGGSVDLSAGTAAVYRDGASVGSGSVTTGALQYYSASVMEFCRYNPVPTRYINGVGAFGAVWGRALSAADHAWMSREPYCFLIPAG